MAENGISPIVGVIGAGVVGGAVGAGFEPVCDVVMYDATYPDEDAKKIIAGVADYVFITVPTDQILDAVHNLNEWASAQRTIIIKSTTPIGMTRKLASWFPDHEFVSNPEFLTNRSARFGFINLSRIIIGGVGEVTRSVAALYKLRFPEAPLITTSWEGAELAKYVTNCFFIVKIAYANEVFEMCQKAGVDYEKLKEMWLLDGRVAHSHADVPGPDGNLGYGGKCFPENLQDILEWGEIEGLPLDILRAARNVNQRVRDGGT